MKVYIFKSSSSLALKKICQIIIFMICFKVDVSACSFFFFFNFLHETLDVHSIPFPVRCFCFAFFSVYLLIYSSCAVLIHRVLLFLSFFFLIYKSLVGWFIVFFIIAFGLILVLSLLSFFLCFVSVCAFFFFNLTPNV